MFFVFLQTILPSGQFKCFETVIKDNPENMTYTDFDIASSIIVRLGSN
jgi:hypothetical protein